MKQQQQQQQINISKASIAINSFLKSFPENQWNEVIKITLLSGIDCIQQHFALPTPTIQQLRKMFLHPETSPLDSILINTPIKQQQQQQHNHTHNHSHTQHNYHKEEEEYEGDNEQEQQEQQEQEQQEQKQNEIISKITTPIKTSKSNPFPTVTPIHNNQHTPAPSSKSSSTLSASKPMLRSALKNSNNININSNNSTLYMDDYENELTAQNININDENDFNSNNITLSSLSSKLPTKDKINKFGRESKVEFNEDRNQYSVYSRGDTSSSNNSNINNEDNNNNNNNSYNESATQVEIYYDINGQPINHLYKEYQFKYQDENGSQILDQSTLNYNGGNNNNSISGGNLNNSNSNIAATASLNYKVISSPVKNHGSKSVDNSNRHKKSFNNNTSMPNINFVTTPNDKQQRSQINNNISGNNLSNSNNQSTSINYQDINPSFMSSTPLDFTNTNINTSGSSLKYSTSSNGTNATKVHDNNSNNKSGINNFGDGLNSMSLGNFNPNFSLGLGASINGGGNMSSSGLNITGTSYNSGNSSNFGDNSIFATPKSTYIFGNSNNGTNNNNSLFNSSNKSMNHLSNFSIPPNAIPLPIHNHTHHHYHNGKGNSDQELEIIDLEDDQHQPQQQKPFNIGKRNYQLSN